MPVDVDTLVVASGAALPYAENEVNSIVNSGLRCHVLEGQQATRDRVLDAAKRGGWQRWWFVAHGDSSGVHLTDGIMAAPLLTQYARRSGIDFLFLNTCESEHVARLIQQELQIVLICTITQVEDYAAYSTGALLADAIARTGNYWQAFQASRPGQSRDYLFLPENFAGMMQPQNETDKRLRTIEETVGRLKVIVFGDETYDVQGLRTDVRKLENEVSKLRNDMNSQFLNVRAQLSDTRDSPFAHGWLRVLFVVFVVVVLFGALFQIAGSLGWIG